jgi:hypothetical protein
MLRGSNKKVLLITLQKGDKMGREVKRVPLDFKWPLGAIWPGNINSYCSNMEYVSKGKSEDQCYYCNLYREIIGEDHSGCPEVPDTLPAGEGWQMWETTSEGSPISPVFSTPEELATWLAASGASSFGHSTATREQWLRMITAGWAPGMVADSNGINSGVEACGDK